RARGRHAAPARCAVESRLGDPLRRRRGRDFPVPRPAHDLPRAALRAGELQLHHDARAWLLRPDALAHGGNARGVRLARSLPVLRDVGGHADPDVLHPRGVGRGGPPVPGHPGLRVHVIGVALDAVRESPPAVGMGVVVLYLVGIIYGGLVAMVQPDFKKLIAYSSVAHLGFVMLGIWALTLQSVQGALLVMINHGISTGALFFLAGMLYERR